MDEVAFDRVAPWPAAADGGGASLQLKDANQDDRHVGNWAALAGATTNPPVTVVTWTDLWRYKQDGAARGTGGNRPSTMQPGRPVGASCMWRMPLSRSKNTALTRTEGRMVPLPHPIRLFRETRRAPRWCCRTSSTTDS